MKTILITGANRGIGLALAKNFSTDNKVYALCRSEFPKDELYDNITVVKLDVSDEAAIKEFAAQLDTDNVSVDLLINNAGIAAEDENYNPKVDAASLAELFAINTIAPMMMALHLTPAMKRADKPCMIAISSRMGTFALLDSYSAQYWPYSASKAALCLEVAAFAINEPAIQAISVHPGWVKTDMGGSDAAIEPEASAAGIRKLYESIDTLESGKMYNYDGAPMER